MSSEEFKELISKIKQHKDEWRVEKVLTFDGKYGDEPYQEWEEMVLHKSAELKYKDDVITGAKGKFLRIFLDKMYPKKDFEQEEWEEIKQLLDSENDNEENNWVQEKEKLEKELQKLKDQGNQAKLTKRVKELEGVVEQLKTENEKLKQQIQELKKENGNTPEYQAYLNKKENELQTKQSKLQQLESIISSNNNNNPWPMPIIIGGGIVMVALLGLIVYKISKNKK